VGGWVWLALGCSANQPPKVAPQVTAAEPVAAPRPESATGAGTVAPVAPATPPEGAPEEPGARELQPEEDLESAESEAPPEAASPAAADPATLLHESLDLYASSDGYWKRGELDDAFAALDHAFELMAQVPPTGDELLAQEKENLRALISRRIVEIYASRQTAVGNPDGAIPLISNDDVQAEIRSFQGPERDFFLEAYRRSGLYRPRILAQLQEAGLPEQLAWLPIVESGFKERALSSARALGLWQFIASTGYRYGLDRSDWIDERMDPEKSTQAALAYLTALHNLFGDWLTALAAYNCGERNVLREIQNQRVGYFDQFWDLYQRLPRETRRYVPRFLAVLTILDDPKAYGFELPQPYAPVAYETVEVSRPAKLEALDQALGLETGTLARLNPELRRNASPNRAYPLKVPPGSGPALVASLDRLPKYEPPPAAVTSIHRVRSGETLSSIAARYRTSVGELMALNRLRSASRLSIGQRLQIPGRGGSAAPSAAVAPAPQVAPPSGVPVQHRVRSGENLWVIAARYGTTVEQIRRDNDLKSNDLMPGQLLTIRPGPTGRG
jgi:membrane-bound lytic murein transglycosylase D